jgi:outer membrane biosynthesis protein TonB
MLPPKPIWQKFSFWVRPMLLISLGLHGLFLLMPLPIEPETKEAVETFGLDAQPNSISVGELPDLATDVPDISQPKSGAIAEPSKGIATPNSPSGIFGASQQPGILPQPSTRPPIQQPIQQPPMTRAPITTTVPPVTQPPVTQPTATQPPAQPSNLPPAAQQPATQQPAAQPSSQQPAQTSGTAASGTSTSGTAASGTPTPGTTASGTPTPGASSTPVLQTRDSARSTQGQSSQVLQELIAAHTLDPAAVPAVKNILPKNALNLSFPADNLCFEDEADVLITSVGVVVQKGENDVLEVIDGTTLQKTEYNVVNVWVDKTVFPAEQPDPNEVIPNNMPELPDLDILQWLTDNAEGAPLLEPSETAKIFIVPIKLGLVNNRCAQ